MRFLIFFFDFFHVREFSRAAVARAHVRASSEFHPKTFSKQSNFFQRLYTFRKQPKSRFVLNKTF